MKNAHETSESDKRGEVLEEKTREAVLRQPQVLSTPIAPGLLPIVRLSCLLWQLRYPTPYVWPGRHDHHLDGVKRTQTCT